MEGVYFINTENPTMVEGAIKCLSKVAQNEGFMNKVSIIE